jgi:Tfp pilus assembly protein PilF
LTDGREPRPLPDPSPAPPSTAAVARGPEPPGGADRPPVGADGPREVTDGGTVTWSPPEPPEPPQRATEPLVGAAPRAAPPGAARPASSGAPLEATLRLTGADGPPPAPAVHLAVGEVLAHRFRIVRFIGRGGMGDVYEAEDLELGERVALKTVRSEIAHLEGAVDRFRREIHLARKVTHPNVCRIFDVFRHRPEAGPEITFFSMELLPGETLEQRLRGGGRMRPEEALPIVRQVTEGLTAAHHAGVIHRDFKPANILLVPASGAPRAVITDFGLARTHGGEENLTVRGDILGTPSYMAPEQVTGGEVTSATDIYALGCVLYEMVTGTPPFVGANSFSTALKRVQEDPRPPHQHVPGLPPAWDAAILRCLERAPADRFAQARDVAAALGGEAFAPGPRRRRLLRRRALAAAGILALLVVLAFAGARWLRPAGGHTTVRSAVAPLADVFSSPADFYAEGVKLLGKRDPQQAQERFEKAVRARPDDWLAHSGLAVALADLGHDDRAGKEAKQAFDHAATLPREQQLLVGARYWQVAGRWDKAVASYQDLHRAVPDDVDDGIDLVRALIGAGRGKDALQLLTELRQQPAAAAAAASRLDLAEAEVQKALSDFPREGQAARRAREQAERDGDELLAARAMCYEAGAAGHQGDREAALTAYKRAEAIFAGAADQRDLAQVLWATAGLLYYQGKLEDAKAKGQEAVDTFKDVGDLRGQSRALDTLAAIEAAKGDLAGAKNQWAASVENYHRLGDRAQEAEVAGNLGLALKEEGKLAAAARWFERSLALFHELQQRSGEAAQLFALAGISFNQMDLPKTDSYLARSLELATAIDDQTLIVDALALEGDVAEARGDLAAVRRKREEALTRGRTVGDKGIIALSQLALAELELDKGHPTQAQAYAQDALNYFHAEQMLDGEAEAGAALGRAFLAQRSLREAQAAMERAGRLAAKSRQPETRVMVALAQARLAEAVRPEEARRILGSALAEAQAAGLGPLALEVRLTLGEIEARHGDRGRAAEGLAALEQEARSHGFTLIADQAARTRAGGRADDAR